MNNQAGSDFETSKARLSFWLDEGPNRRLGESEIATQEHAPAHYTQGRNGQNNLAADALEPHVVPSRQDAHTRLGARYGGEDCLREDPPHQVIGYVDQ